MSDLHTDDFDYELPPELIAQCPAPRRDASRLMVIDRATGAISHGRFADLPDLLDSGDLVVANRSRVVPARIRARKLTGGAVELLLVRRLAKDRWSVLARPSRKLRPGGALRVDGGRIHAHLMERQDHGEWTVEFSGVDDVSEELSRVGALPLPPYIRDPDAPSDRYQTVYADQDGSIAAPTAGLHFTDDLLCRLQAAGIDIEFVTLHVGLGTFQPVAVDRVADHQMHAEWGEVPEDVAQRLTRALGEGRRIVSVGTTTTRLLETAAGERSVRPYSGETRLFIYPGYAFQAVGALITNFHLPRSTLLMLVGAFAGRDLMLEAYAEAVRHQYRFYSFGDAMLIR